MIDESGVMHPDTSRAYYATLIAMYSAKGVTVQDVKISIAYLKMHESYRECAGIILAINHSGPFFSLN